MRRHVSRIHTGLLVALLAKVLLAGAALAAVCWAGEHWLLAQWQVQATAPKALGLLATIAAGTVVFFALAAALRIDEVTQVMALVRQRLSRPRPRS
jgi:peptidoglycan biosynthesis protein MviN/MurJ (putative lipid II flippase)